MSDYDGSRGIRLLILENHEPIYSLMHPDVDKDQLLENFEQLLDAMLEEHAHELAEKQRNHVRRHAWNTELYGSGESAIQAVDDVADLIDPKAE